MDKRLPVTEETHARMTAFREGAGMTFDEAVNLLLDLVSEKGQEYDVGAKLSYELKTGKRQRKDDVTE